MSGRKSKEIKAALAEDLLRRVESPKAPQRLQVYGLQRILARAAYETRTVERRWFRNPALWRRAVVLPLTALLLLAAGTSGVYAASMDAPPGSALYGCKIFFERARVALTVSRSSDARLEMEFCERRLRELQGLPESGEYRAWERWSREYRRNLEGVDSLLDALPAEESAGLAARFQAQLEEHHALMEGLLKITPAPYLPYLQQASRECMERLQRLRHRHGMEEEERGQPRGPREEEGTTPVGDTGSEVQDGAEESGPCFPSPSYPQAELEDLAPYGEDTAPSGMAWTSDAEDNWGSSPKESNGVMGEGSGHEGKGSANHYWK